MVQELYVGTALDEQYMIHDRVDPNNAEDVKSRRMRNDRGCSGYKPPSRGAGWQPFMLTLGFR